jgi:hypothetical protein
MQSATMYQYDALNENNPFRSSLSVPPASPSEYRPSARLSRIQYSSAPATEMLPIALAVAPVQGRHRRSRTGAIRHSAHQVVRPSSEHGH